MGFFGSASNLLRTASQYRVFQPRTCSLSARCSDDLSSVDFAAASLISVAAMFCLKVNTFVPPVSAWKVDDPQNWVDLVALEDNRACCGTPGNSLANAGQPRFGGGCNLKSCTISAAASFSSRDCAPAAPKGSTPGAVSH